MGETGRHYLDDVRQQFAAQRALAERAVAQLDAQQLFRSDGHDANSVAVLMQHVGGNLSSRWTDALTSDGEKPDRDRDAEFEMAGDTTVAELTVRWNAGWQQLEDALAAFTPDDLLRIVIIRRQPLTLLQALQRSLAHTAQHVGQIVMLAKQCKGADWQTLSIPRRRSAEYLRQPPV
jgi:uncharacterized damage-inducible protein DinB